MADMEEKDAVDFLESLLGRQFRLHTDDGRIFLGDFKCTDNVSLASKQASALLIYRNAI